MVSSKMKGFPARGSTLYVFSLEGESPHSAAGMLTTEGYKPAAEADENNSGTR
jgi:hypothetical protein